MCVCMCVYVPGCLPLEGEEGRGGQRKGRKRSCKAERNLRGWGRRGGGGGGEEGEEGRRRGRNLARGSSHCIKASLTWDPTLFTA